jgi:hypothetical protein
MKVSKVAFLFALAMAASAGALLSTNSRTTRSRPQCPPQNSPLAALTERQQQFWEDVERGLDDIADFYQSKKGMDIDRIRQFGKR